MDNIYFNSDSAVKKLSVSGKDYLYYDISSLDKSGDRLSRLPFSLKILLESALRNFDGKLITMEHIERISSWNGKGTDGEIPFIPSRIVLQDFTGVPVAVDLAAMRAKLKEMGGDPEKINPAVPVDLVIDHSVIVDSFGSRESLDYNVRREFERNEERYKLLKWAQNAFSNFRVFPPSVGIVHQVNLEYLASVASTRMTDKGRVVLPDTLVGTDSHTTMINGIGVLGWGVGGIEAEACMLGQPLYFLLPDIIGFELSGSLPAGATATDLVLTITNILRKTGVVGKFVEFYGEGVRNISVEDRATIANMCPEYGATAAYFPVDDKTLDYLRATGRSEEQILLAEKYFKAQGMYRTEADEKPLFTDELHLDLSSVEPSLAGPRRPQDRIPLREMKKKVSYLAVTPISDGGYGLDAGEIDKIAEIEYRDGTREQLKTGAVVISAITSCTNTSNPAVIIGAGLLAKKAVELGLKKPRYVKSSLAPGSLVVTDYLEKSGLLTYLEELGYNIVGYGCTTCIGNSGPLAEEVTKAIVKHDITVASVLSGNRNFEGRIHPLTKMNFLASPLLVVAYGLAGTIQIDFDSEPIGYTPENQPVYLKDIWPDPKEIYDTIHKVITPEMYRSRYRDILKQNELWNSLQAPDDQLYQWSESSTYIRKPPFFDNMGTQPEKLRNISGAHVLALLGDSVTTDHISPAGSIPETSDAGIHLTSQNVEPQHYNSYGSRRGTHEVMMRGTFANIRIRNRMLPEVEGGFTRHIPSGEIMSIYRAGMKYKDKGIPLIVVAGREYGTGSSRDWAAKGTALLGVKAVLAESFERIHRSNLIGMGVLPLQFMEGENADKLGITGYETFQIEGVTELAPNKPVDITGIRRDGTAFHFKAVARLESNVELEYYEHGGILNMILRSFLNEA
ncbi:MAG TPA: aconitate hydratase AcnA [Clostridiales bacterium]|nr:aconitate hydratase AcnA [Clostridiales bacterium]